MARPTTRTAIVTGGSGGIGRAVAERLAADGYAVVVHYSGNERRAAETVEAITGEGGTAVATRADVADENQVVALFDSTERRFGGVDAVVHTAGIMELAPLAETEFDMLDRMLRTNVRGTLAVAREAARRVRGGGAIVTFSSTVVRLALPTYAGYAATKGAVEAMTLILARELRGRDITVNAVAPGPTATPLFLDGKDEATVSRLAAQSPLERLGTPVDIAGAVSFLTGPDGRWINGQVLAPNGGAA
ncbi:MULTISPECIES: SDR family oxidoreductase [Pseudonocardia]|uniref:3-oxoacyl-[acyl-carrier-protein] reductase FabG n=2 Tax=Pseudonocardia TaxID=1847 RepID=A0A1Y2N266_PSEAH|nr:MULTISPECIES: SDR family oxidoreductase [Pseudonocardia]OSY41269.1 3-oxoacyl-[acyl-carrier-protein] reductase FabG [Pseudonocardia autotrophica]TDN76724.1 3-oxoacyl-[acyl-carrier protein] reductase [Pseudonocardia autotrophica]BBG00726.1 3-oxoacyl-ACP reductase [Pseudonocardia autotrophica]GEC24308.1 3-oxoacyl-ACP reductase [Pseudonocardia saturnea]